MARKPKWRMRTKPLGSVCNRKRPRNSSSDRVINLGFMLAHDAHGFKSDKLAAQGAVLDKLVKSGVTSGVGKAEQKPCG